MGPPNLFKPPTKTLSSTILLDGPAHFPCPLQLPIEDESFSAMLFDAADFSALQMKDARCLKMWRSCGFVVFSKVALWLLPVGMPEGDGITFVCDETCLTKDFTVPDAAHIGGMLCVCAAGQLYLMCVIP